MTLLSSVGNALLVVTILLVRGAAAETATLHNRLTLGELDAGWKLLFDGKSTSGWRNYRSKTISDGWRVVGGVLTCADEHAGDIITVGKYEAFELQLDFKIGIDGNSGVMYHVTEDAEAPWQTGPEIQIMDYPKDYDGQKTGWLYELYPSDHDTMKPIGQWNRLRVVVTPAKCEQFLNGTKYCEYVKGSADWDARVAASKFATYKQFGRAVRGHICLQAHGNEITFRNIKIRELADR